MAYKYHNARKMSKVHENDRPRMTSTLRRLILRSQNAFVEGNKFVFKLLRNKVSQERKAHSTY